MPESPDVLTERARIQGLVEGRTLPAALADTVASAGDHPAYSDRHHAPEGESWRTLTWTQTRDLALDVTGALLERGVSPGDTVAIVGGGPIGLAALLTAQFYSPAEIIMIDVDDNRLEVDFEKAGQKRVLDSFVEKAS